MKIIISIFLGCCLLGSGFTNPTIEEDATDISSNSKHIKQEIYENTLDIINRTDSEKHITEVLHKLKKQFFYIDTNYQEDMPIKYWLRLGQTYLASLPKIVGFIEDDICFSVKHNNADYWKFIIESAKCLDIIKMRYRTSEAIEELTCYILLISVILENINKKPSTDTLFLLEEKNKLLSSLEINTNIR